VVMSCSRLNGSFALETGRSVTGQGRMCIVRMHAAYPILTQSISKLLAIISSHDHGTKEGTEKTYRMIHIIRNNWFLHTEIKSRQ